MSDNRFRWEVMADDEHGRSGWAYLAHPFANKHQRFWGVVREYSTDRYAIKLYYGDGALSDSTDEVYAFEDSLESAKRVTRRLITDILMRCLDDLQGMLAVSMGLVESNE